MEELTVVGQSHAFVCGLAILKKVEDKLRYNRSCELPQGMGPGTGYLCLGTYVLPSQGKTIHPLIRTQMEGGTILAKPPAGLLRSRALF